MVRDIEADLCDLFVAWLASAAHVEVHSDADMLWKTTDVPLPLCNSVLHALASRQSYKTLL